MDKKFLTSYKLTKPYPFQKVGDIIQRCASTEQWKFVNTGIVIDSKLLTTDYFEPIYFSKQVGDTALYKDFNKLRIGKIREISSTGKVTLAFSDNFKPKSKVVDYTKVSDVIRYYHFNSNLQCCLAEVVSEKKLEEMNHRIKLGNCFEEKEKCVAVIRKIMELLKND